MTELMWVAGGAVAVVTSAGFAKVLLALLEWAKWIHERKHTSS